MKSVLDTGIFSIVSYVNQRITGWNLILKSKKIKLDEICINTRIFSIVSYVNQRITGWNLILKSKK